MSFARELQKALEQSSFAALEADGGEHEQAVITLHNLLAQPDSLRRRITLRILERRAAKYLKTETQVIGAAPQAIAGQIDWSAVPWEQIITGLLKVLFLLLPFIL